MAGYFFGCPHCRAKLEARDASRAGRTVTCPQCQQALIIPPPPPMGLSLPQSEGEPAADSVTQFVVSSDPGFKRVMSPAKAFGEGTDAAPSHSGSDKLPPADALQTPESNTLAASDDIEGYSFTIPEVDTDIVSPPAFVFKPKKKRPEAEEAPHPFEDPKNQLAALVGVVLVIVAIGAVWSWLRGNGKDQDKDKPAESSTEVPADAPPAPLPPIAPPADPAVVPDSGGDAPDPGAAPPTPNSSLLPGAPVPAPIPPETSAELPGAVPNVLPGGDSERKPGTAPRSLPESTPNVLPGSQP